MVLALIAWPPIGLAAAQLLGDLTGCDRYAASCSQPASLLGWLAQPVVVAVLLLLPRLAQVAAVASLVVGVAALGGAAVLSSMGGTRAPAAASSLLLAILVMAYAVGLIGALSGRVPLPPWLSGRR